MYTFFICHGSPGTTYYYSIFICHGCSHWDLRCTRHWIVPCHGCSHWDAPVTELYQYLAPESGSSTCDQALASASSALISFASLTTLTLTLSLLLLLLPVLLLSPFCSNSCNKASKQLMASRALCFGSPWNAAFGWFRSYNFCNSINAPSPMSGIVDFLRILNFFSK